MNGQMMVYLGLGGCVFFLLLGMILLFVFRRSRRKLEQSIMSEYEEK